MEPINDEKLLHLYNEVQKDLYMQYADEKMKILNRAANVFEVFDDNEQLRYVSWNDNNIKLSYYNYSSRIINTTEFLNRKFIIK